MVIEISSIHEVKSIREQKSRLSERERELTEPRLTDLSLIDKLYSFYETILPRPSERRASSRHNQQFTLVILYLYSPSSLAGGYMKNGLRMKLANVMGFKSPTGVTNICKDVVFKYTNIKQYKNEVDSLYTQLIEFLSTKN